MDFGDKGFTLVELIVTIIIVGILVAMSCVVMSNATQKAIRTEAIVAMRMISLAEERYYAGHRAYVSITQGDEDVEGKWRSICIEPSDLEGQYYSLNCYEVLPGGIIMCDPTDSSAPQSDKITNWNRLLTVIDRGVIYEIDGGRWVEIS